MADIREIPSKIKWMQRFFSIAGDLAPSTAINIMVRMVFTPKKRTLRPPHADLLRKAHKHIFRVNEFRKKDSKLKVKYYEWGKGEKTVFLIHGWEGMALDFYKMIPVLLEAGYKVVAMDGPAHGGSEGKITNLLHFKETMHTFFDKYGMPYAIIGHSMGGASAAYLLMEPGVTVKRFVMVTIPISSKKFFDEVFELLKVPVKMQRVFYKGMEKEFNTPIESMDLAIRKEKIKAAKALVIYDEQDEEIAPEDVEAFLEKRPSFERMKTVGAGHNKIIRNKEVIQRIIDFLE